MKLNKEKQNPQTSKQTLSPQKNLLKYIISVNMYNVSQPTLEGITASILLWRRGRGVETGCLPVALAVLEHVD